MSGPGDLDLPLPALPGQELPEAVPLGRVVDLPTCAAQPSEVVEVRGDGLRVGRPAVGAGRQAAAPFQADRVDPPVQSLA